MSVNTWVLCTVILAFNSPLYKRFFIRLFVTGSVAGYYLSRINADMGLAFFKSINVEYICPLACK